MQARWRQGRIVDREGWKTGGNRSEKIVLPVFLEDRKLAIITPDYARADLRVNLLKNVDLLILVPLLDQYLNEKIQLFNKKSNLSLMNHLS